MKHLVKDLADIQKIPDLGDYWYCRIVMSKFAGQQCQLDEKFKSLDCPVAQKELGVQLHLRNGALKLQWLTHQQFSCTQPGISKLSKVMYTMLHNGYTMQNFFSQLRETRKVLLGVVGEAGEAHL